MPEAPQAVGVMEDAGHAAHDGNGRVVGVHGQANVGLLRGRDDGPREIEKAGPHFFFADLADLVSGLSNPLPVQVIARLMGLPREDYVRFQQLSIELLSVVYDWDIGIAASASLKEYFGEVLAERRRDPQDDLISTLAESEIDGARLSDDDDTLASTSGRVARFLSSLWNRKKVPLAPR